MRAYVAHALNSFDIPVTYDADRQLHIMHDSNPTLCLFPHGEAYPLPHGDG
jgi:hypothetical protein